MALRISRQIRLPSAFLHDDIVAGILALRHVIIRYIRNGEQHVRHVLLCFVHDFLKCLVGRLQLCHLFLYAVSFIFPAFFHQSADLPGKLVLLLLVRVELLLCLTTQTVIFQYFLNGLTRTDEVFLLQSLDDTFGLLTDEL